MRTTITDRRTSGAAAAIQEGLVNMKTFWKEFKQFALRGNVLELAVGVVIGSAFSAIVTALVDNLISPLIGLLVNVNFSDLSAKIGGVTFNYGAFLMAVLNFIIVAFVLFLLVRTANTISKVTSREEAAAPTTKKCPYCKSEIDIDATRCPHCTSQLEE